MIGKKDLRRVSDEIYEIPRDFRRDMRVPARVYADEKMVEATLGDRSVEQLVNTATLPGIVGYAMAMPDIHQGYGFPIGGVVASRVSDGVVSPGGVGYDINCGVRLLGSKLSREDVIPFKEELATALYRRIPSGVGKGGSVRLRRGELDEVLETGAEWAVKRNFARPDDIERTEEGGRLAGADPAKASSKAKERGSDQIGTLGSGNHFIEVDEVVEVYDPDAADAFGLFPGQVAVFIHSGSRGFGHQVCTDYVRGLQQAVRDHAIRLPDRELVCAPVSSGEGQAYLAAMACAANYAWANRQVMAHFVRMAFEEALGGRVRDWDLYQVYDVAHNIAKIEEYEIDGRPTRVCVHRKGATRAFGPGSPDVPAAYRFVGQPVLVPGSMGTASYVLAGTKAAMETTFGSTCHGAGRTQSRAAAKRQVRGDQLRDRLQSGGIAVRTGSLKGLAEEAPSAYKDVDRVVEVVHRAGIGRRVAKLRPIAVVKG